MNHPLPPGQAPQPLPLLNAPQLKELREMPEKSALKLLLNRHKMRRSQATKLLSAIRRKH